MDLGRCAAFAGGSRSRTTHVSTTRVPGVPRGRAREIVRRRLRAFLHSDAPTHGPHGSWLAGRPMRANASDTPTQPASPAGEQRSESPARARGSDARRVCPRVVHGCRSRQAMSRAQRSASRWQRDAWTGARPTRTQKGSPGSNDIDSRRRGGKAAAPGRPEPGARESVAGRRSLPDGRHSGSSFRSASIHASAAGGGLGPSQEGRQGCQRLGRLLAQALRRSESLCREAGESPGTQAEACAARNQRGAGARTKT